MNTPEHDLDVMLAEQDEADCFCNEVEKMAEQMCKVPSIAELFLACRGDQSDDLMEIIYQAAEAEVRRQINEANEV